MSDPQQPDLLHRIAALERANRRWKALAFGFAGLLAILFAIGAAFSVSMSLRATAARQEALEQMHRAEQERHEAMQQQRLAEQRLEEAKRAGEKKP